MKFSRFLMVFLLLAVVPTLSTAQTNAPPMQRSNATLSGTATDGSGTAVAGVTVKVFEEGFLLEEVETAADGSYRLRFGYLPDIDWTIIAWFMPPEGDLVPEILILRENLRSKRLELWSSCLPRLELGASMHFDLQLLDGKTKRQQISELDCLRTQDQ